MSFENISTERLSKKQAENLNFPYRRDIVLEMRLSGVAEQGYTIVYGKSQMGVTKWLKK
jgi:hypothetical protein